MDTFNSFLAPNNIQMSFGERLLSLRKKHSLSQSELAERVGIHKNVLGKYERNEVKPSIDIAIKIADFFNVTLDFLTAKVDKELNPIIADKILSIQNLPEKDQDYILFTLDAMLRDAKSRFAYSV